MNPASAPSPDSRKRTLALILLPILAIALAGVVIWLHQNAKSKGMVALVVSGDDAAAAAINTGDIIDATIPGVEVAPLLGRRYKVFVEDESDDRSSGIAKIGGRATFIPGARRGQTAIVDTTRVRDRVVDAILVKVLGQIVLPPKAPREPFVPRADDPAAIVVAGAEMDVLITEASSRNPETEGVAKVAGLVVFVNGATTIGERVNVRITERRERLAFAEPTGQPAGTAPLPYSAAPARRAFQPRPGDSAAHVVPGAEMDVIVSEASEKNPGQEGIAKVAGLVVVVAGAPTLGERVNVRIVDRKERIAFAERTGQPAGTDPLPEYARPAPARAPRVFQPRPGDPVVVGAEMDVVVSEASEKNPATEGVARIGGLVVFVQGVTTLGERVNVRITERHERLAVAQPTGQPAGAGPLPEYSLPAPAPRPFSPRPGDPAAFVMPGAEMDVIISEASEKNPATEGVARVAGLVVFVQGATAIGERVNIRITDRRDRMAFAELSGQPAGTAPLPVEAPRPPRPAYGPRPGDSAPHVVPGAVIATTIVEPSTKNPTTEGIAKIDGFVIFVKGATTPGQAVNVRITDRRPSIAMGEVTTDPVTAAAPMPAAASAAVPAPPALAPTTIVPVTEPVPPPADTGAPSPDPAPAPAP